MTVPGHRPLSEQLASTLAFAVEHIAWYRERAEVYRGPILSSNDLARLPIIDRATVMADQRAFASADTWPSAVSYSSSTTGGIGQPRWRNDAEQRALVELLGAPDPDGGAGGPVAEAVTLVIHPYDQGPPVAPPAATRRIYVGMLVPWHFDLIHEILAEGWASPSGRVPITAVDCFSPGLRILTEWFDQRGIDPLTFGVTDLVGYGSIQPGVWRRRLEQAWGARYRDLYGLSEVVLGESAQCPLCHAYHFPLPVVPEVVDLVTRQPIPHGAGILLLTELYPYAQLQLLLRYWTDDIVELARPCPIGGFGIFFRGRRSSSVVVDHPGGVPLIIGSLQVGEVCAEVPDVAVNTITWAPWAGDVGTPRFSLHAAGPDVTVTVELRYRPSLFPARAREVANELEAMLRGEVSGLSGALDEGQARLRVVTVGPGDLRDAIKV